MTAGIYKIMSPSNKIYIGQSRNLLSREKSYKRKNGYKYQIRLRNSIEKYGWKNHVFEVIEECKLEELNKRERFWQDHYDVLGPNGLNCILQETDTISRKTSAITRSRMSESRKKDKNPMFGKFHSESTKIKISNSLKGKLSGKNHPAYGTTHNRNKKGEEAINYGMIHSKESKLKMSKSQKGKTVSKEGRKNISEAKKGDSNPNSKLVLDVILGVFYFSAKEASEYSIYSYDKLKRILSGEYKNNTNLIYC